MPPVKALGLLCLSAMLEAGGDALVRRGLHSLGWPARLGLLALGGCVLFAYGVVVNLPPWDFGRLLGVYVALFFVVAQAINLLFFGVAPSSPVLLGGALILAGGMVVAFWQG
jgi:small multidrug resistance family-3 protein